VSGHQAGLATASLLLVHVTDALDGEFPVGGEFRGEEQVSQSEARSWRSRSDQRQRGGIAATLLRERAGDDSQEQVQIRLRGGDPSVLAASSPAAPARQSSRVRHFLPFRVTEAITKTVTRSAASTRRIQDTILRA